MALNETEVNIDFSVESIVSLYIENTGNIPVLHFSYLKDLIRNNDIDTLLEIIKEFETINAPRESKEIFYFDLFYLCAENYLECSVLVLVKWI